MKIPYVPRTSWRYQPPLHAGKYRSTADLSYLMTLSAVCLLWCGPTCAQTVHLSGQLSAWMTAHADAMQTGARYLPEWSLSQRFAETYEISVEAALDAHGFVLFDHDDTQSDAASDPYRLWSRLAASQFELRVGLQKINFGSATLLRPLRWFDSLDPRDPLQLTDGVWGVLGRYYFLNNANIWLWGLYGNEDLKGWEMLPTDERSIEAGGRLQMPVAAGEMGLAYHYRQVDPSGSEFGTPYPAQGVFPEHRIGLDGKWDLGVGVWFEGTVTRQSFHIPEPRYQHLLTVGMDYTFDVGNGLHVLGEHVVRMEAKNAFSSGASQSISALSVDYPLSLLDTVSGIVYYDWEQRDGSLFLTWQRTYDRWQVHVSAFWSSNQAIATGNPEGTSSIAGNGVRLMLVMHH